MEKKKSKRPLNKGNFSKDRQPEKAGRHKLGVDPESVYKLGLIHCTAEEAASVLGCHKDTIYNRFFDDLKRGHEDGQMSIKRKMHEKALSGAGDNTMLIWISKQRLGYKDRQPEDTGNVNLNVYIDEVPK